MSLDQSTNRTYNMPVPLWLELAINGKLVARFDPARGILEIRDRCECHTFDLAQMVEQHRTRHNASKPERQERQS